MSPTNAQIGDGFSSMQSWARRSLMFGVVAALLAIVGAGMHRVFALLSIRVHVLEWLGARMHGHSVDAWGGGRQMGAAHSPTVRGGCADLA